MSITSILHCEDTLFKCYTTNTTAAEYHQEGKLKQKVTYMREIQDRYKTKGLEIVNT